MASKIEKLMNPGKAKAERMRLDQRFSTMEALV